MLPFLQKSIMATLPHSRGTAAASESNKKISSEYAFENMKGYQKRSRISKSDTALT